MSRNWRQPQLIRLVRGRLEEFVLGSCKAQFAPPWGPDNNWGGCSRECSPLEGLPCDGYSVT